MTIQEGLLDYLLDQSAITAIVSQRIYPMVVPQGQPLPSITLQKISEQENYHLGGTTSLRVARMQIDCYAATPKAASDLSELVRTAMSTQRLLMGTVEVTSVFRENSRDTNERSDNGSDPGDYRNSTDYMIHYRS